MGLSLEDKARLDVHNYLTPAGGVNRKKLAIDIRDLLVSAHEIKKPPYPQEVARVGVMVGTLVSQLLDEPTEGLTALMANMTTTSAQGPVQKVMPNGYVLGSGRVPKEVVLTQDDGTEIKKQLSVTVRWVSRNPKVIKELLLQPLLEKQDARGRRDQTYLAMIQQRQKSLDSFIRNELTPGLSDRYAAGLGLVPELEEGDDEGSGDEEATG